MAKKIQIDIEVNGKMQKATVSANKLRKALDGVDKGAAQAGKSAGTLDRNLKGAAQASANGTKNFSKMAQGIGGKLVPAYATLAANIFAVTAAFNAFQKAAQIEKLETTLVRIGNVGGRNLGALADNLKTITGNAIDSEQALRTVAQGTTQGFSASQLQDLTTIAKGASIQLGRSLPDALDRLVRGTAKLEPEILDELGIIVRLDDAADRYATTLGKTANQLTQYERQQAFANAVTEQGLKKFGEVAALAEANPYDQLASTFGDLLKGAFEGLNAVLEPFIKFLAESPMGLVGVVAMFGSTIVNQLTPALSDMAEQGRLRFSQLNKEAKAAAAAVETKYGKALKKLQKTDISPAGFKKVEAAIRQGTASTKQFEAALRSLRASERKRQTDLTKLQAATKGLRGAQRKAHLELVAEKERELALIQSQIVATNNLAAVENRRGGSALMGGGTAAAARAQNTGARAGIGRTEAAASRLMQQKGVFGQFQVAGAAAKKMTGKIGNATGALSKLSLGFKVAGASARLFGSALLNAIPVVGQALFIATILGETFVRIFGNPFADNAIEAASKQAIKALEEMKKASNDVKEAMANAGSETESTFIKLVAGAGQVGQFSTQLKSLAKAADDVQNEKLAFLRERAAGLNEPSSLAGVFSPAGRERTKAMERLEERGIQYKTTESTRRGTRTNYNEALIREEIQAIRDEAVAEAEANFDAKISGSEVRNLLEEQRKLAVGEGIIDQAAIDMIDAKLKEIGNSAQVSANDMREFAIALDETQEPTRRFTKAFDDLSPAFSEFDKEFNALIKKTNTPVTALQQRADSIGGIFKTISEDFPKGADVTDLNELISKKGGERAERFAKTLAATIPNYEALTEPEKANALNTAFIEFKKTIDEADTTFRDLASKITANKTAQEEANRFSKTSLFFTEEAIRLEKEAVGLKIEENSAMLKTLELSEKDAETGEHKAEVQAEITRLTNENNSLIEKQNTIEDNSLRTAQAKFNQEQRFLNLANKILQVKKETARIEAQEQQTADTAALREAGKNPFFEFIDQGRMQLTQEIAALEAKIEFEKENSEAINNMKTAMINAEYALIDAQLRAEMEKLRIRSGDMSEGVTQAQRDSAAASADRIQTLIGEESGGGTLGEARGEAVENVARASEASVGSLQEKLKGLKQSKADLNDINVLSQGVADSLTSNMTSAFTSLIDGTKNAKQAFGDMAKAILADIASMISKMLVQRAIMAAFGFADGGVAPGGFQAFAYGGIAQGGFRKFASGGVVDRPTLGLVGEGKYNEAIVPLPDGNAIPVDMKGAAGNTNNVTVNVSVASDGQSKVSQNGDSGGMDLGRVIAGAVQEELQRQKRPGGVLSPYGAA